MSGGEDWTVQLGAIRGVFNPRSKWFTAGFNLQKPGVETARKTLWMYWGK